MLKNIALPTKRRLLLLVFPLFCIILFSAISLWPSWPTKARLCRDLEAFIPNRECLETGDRFAILDRAFLIGSTSSTEIKTALGGYLSDEFQTELGHIEIYHLSVHPVDYLISFPDEYIFSYDENGTFLGYSYQD